MPNAVKSDNLVYHKECVPEHAVSQAAIDVDEEETCENCGKDFTVGNTAEDADDQVDENREEDEAAALGTTKAYDPNDALRER